MAKKHKHPEHENLERWLVSYADFITLLFATFTALYALSLSDVNKLKDIAAAIREGFEEQSIISGINSILQGSSPPSRNPDAIAPEKGSGAGVVGKFESMTYKPGEIKSMQEISTKLAQEVQSQNDTLQKQNNQNNGNQGNDKDAQAAGGKEAALYTGEGNGAGTEDKNTALRPIEASVQQRGVRVSFDSRMLFAPGSATLKQDAYKFLDGVAARLKKLDGSNVMHIEGHTDDIPISTAVFPSNWELSSARAGSIVRYLIEKQGFKPQSLVAVGYGASQPIATNKTAEGRAKNRRVDIVLYSQKMSNVVNPRLQYLKEQSLKQQPPLVTRTETEKPKEIIPALPADKDGPVKVIIKDKDGTERVLIPKTEVKIDVGPAKVDVLKPDAKTKSEPSKTDKAHGTEGHH